MAYFLGIVQKGNQGIKSGKRVLSRSDPMKKHLMAIAAALLFSLPHAAAAKDAAAKAVTAQEPAAEDIQDGEEAMTVPAEDMPDVEQPSLEAKEKGATDKSDAETQGEEE
jgi:hypothetical protein